MICTSQFKKKKNDPCDWFCGSHVLLTCDPDWADLLTDLSRFWGSL